MSGLLRQTLLQPLFTGPLLLALTRGSPEVRERILAPLARLPASLQLSPETYVTSLKWLFALGVVRTINALLNRFALNRWQLSAGGKPFDYPREVCVITGGSGGIGSVVCNKLADTGMTVVILDLQPPKGPLANRPNVRFYNCDITDPQSTKDVAAKIKADLGKTPSILVNNAGLGGKATPILEVEQAYLEKLMKINLLSHWNTVKAFMPGMIAEQKGHIIATASMASYVAVAGMVEYCVSKAGVMSFHEGLTQELKHRYNAPFIRTTCIHPFWVRTNMFTNFNDNLAGLQMTPEFAGGKIAEAILKGESGTVILPPKAALQGAGGSRGWPYWMQELVNDGTKTYAA